jgi:hypothetical protein
LALESSTKAIVKQVFEENIRAQNFKDNYQLTNVVLNRHVILESIASYETVSATPLSA